MKKVIVWGHKNNNTFAWIHHAFVKSFKHLGYDTYHFDNEDVLWDLEDFDFSDSLFITEGQVDQSIPIRKDCKYILHNCDLTKYQDTIANCLNLQVYSSPRTIAPGNEVEKIDDYVYYQPKPSSHDGCNNRTLFMPWATSLLPHEFVEYDIAELVAKKSTDKVYWIGSICDGYQGNLNELRCLATTLAKDFGVQLVNERVEDSQQEILVRDSFVVPAIQGQWQVDVGYIPCRVFKNISYGRIPFTNSATVNELFQGKLPYAETKDMKNLVQQTVAREASILQKDYNEIVSFVKDKHTYINRINQLLKFI